MATRPSGRDELGAVGLVLDAAVAWDQEGHRPSWMLSSRSEPGVEAAKRLAQLGTQRLDLAFELVSHRLEGERSTRCRGAPA